VYVVGISSLFTSLFGMRFCSAALALLSAQSAEPAD